MTTINDGIHYNRVARSRELATALQEIITEKQIDEHKFARDYLDRFTVGNSWKERRANSIVYDLTITLQQRTGCELATARGHVAKWLRKFHKRAREMQSP